MKNTAKSSGVYLLPNLFTTAALFAGFYAIVAALKGASLQDTSYFEHAAIALFVAMIMDSVDGRVARLTGTVSDFGAQYDSLSDMLCFGVTPALVTYSWALSTLGKLGWLAAFVYTAATALRLARFNIQSEEQDKKYFIGLPCPAAAAVIASMVWLGVEFAMPGKILSVIVAIVTVIMALCQVSSFKYYSFKDLGLKGNVPFVAVLVVVLMFTLIAFDPPRILGAVFLTYALSGPCLWLYDKYKT
ncbi:MAG: CDP-diacylglycerol--serine O-phosphatidyltransferase [Thiotrichales bacterium]|nr:MAG: CDP-diacylglycerol--serine O-phosphatidyltransferase [Thiotrichales bacterium]